MMRFEREIPPEQRETAEHAKGKKSGNIGVSREVKGDSHAEKP